MLVALLKLYRKATHLAFQFLLAARTEASSPELCGSRYSDGHDGRGGRNRYRDQHWQQASHEPPKARATNTDLKTGAAQTVAIVQPAATKRSLGIQWFHKVGAVAATYRDRRYSAGPSKRRN